MSKTAYSYIRFSSKTQELGDSLRRQLEAAEDYCRRHKLTLSDKNFQDLGVSGFKEVDRASLADMLDAIEQGKIRAGDIILLENVDRLSRQGIDAVRDITSKILRSDVEIVSLSDGLHLTKNSLNDLLDVIRLAISADLAHKESLKKSERISAAKARQRKQAASGNVINKRLAYWLKRESGAYVFNENVDVIRLIIAKRKEGKGFHRIAIELNQSDFKPRYAKKWNDQTIREWVKSRMLYGSYQTGSVVDGKFVPIDLIDDYFPPVISYEEWKAIQPAVVNRVAGHAKHNHLSGVVRCDHCGSAMQKKTSKRTLKTRTIEYKHWICVAKSSGGCDLNEGLRDLDELVFKSTKRLKIVKHQDVQANKLTQQIDVLEAEIKLLSEKLKGSTVTTMDAILGAIKDKEHHIKDLKAKVSSLNGDSVSVDELKSYIEDPVQFNIRLKQLVQKIVVRKKSKSYWHVKIIQHNGHLLNISAFKESQRGSFKFFFSGTEQIVSIGKDDPSYMEY